MILHDGITLYHGSYCPVQKIDMAFCASGKDFGKGFYLTTDLNQAKNDTSKNCMGATIQRRYLAQFFWDLDICQNLSVFCLRCKKYPSPRRLTRRSLFRENRRDLGRLCFLPKSLHFSEECRELRLNPKIPSF